MPWKNKVPKVNGYIFRESNSTFLFLPAIPYDQILSLKSTVKTLKIGTPRLTTVFVVNIKQFDFTMQ